MCRFKIHISDFAKAVVEVLQDTAAAVRKAQSEAPEPPKEEKGKAALTELFNSVKNIPGVRNFVKTHYRNRN